MNDYYIGLDIGTDSVGWAVTKPDYALMKFHGDAMWGIRLLEESQTAAERRGFRNSRRRTQRRKFRIDCLQMLFDSEIAKKDISFFQRLKESNLYSEDKTVDGKYPVFNDVDFTDKDYNITYPTIYHLRKELAESAEPHDVRLVYLAVSHIIKNRGHFLFDSDTLGSNGCPVFSDVWNELCSYMSDHYDDIDLSLDNYAELEDVLKRKISITNKKNALFKIFSVDKNDKFRACVLGLLAGASVEADVLFGNEALKDSEVKKVSFSKGYDDKAADYEIAFGEQFEMLERLKAVYDWAVLADILDGEKYISYAKCNIYDKHKTQLRDLKELIKAYAPEKYNHIFKENNSKTNNYLSYTAHASKGSAEKKCTQADFCDFLKKELPENCPDEKYSYIYREVEAGCFMPKAVSKDNSVIPMQIHKAELVAILNHAENYLQFLSEKDSDGKSVSDKIVDIFSYRIPYYVGPLNQHSAKAWVVRNSEKIYPWNFEKVVNVDQSAEAFIENLTSKCTYLRKEDVLPKNSLLYSKFNVLNELNNLKVNGRELPVDVKQKIYTELFLKRNKVTQKAVRNFLITCNYIDASDCEITGIDGDFKSNMKSAKDLYPYALTDDEKEDVIQAITIFADDKKLLKKRLKAKFSDKLSPDDIQQICKLKYTGWGRLSKKFLSDMIGACVETGEADTIIGFMWKTNNNLMQLLSSRYSFLNVIEQSNDSTFTSLKKEVDDLFVSPKVKRPIYQSMQIVDEIVKINKSEPKKIFIEVARGEETKKRTVSRKDKLIDLYKSLKKDNSALYESLVKTDENEFRRDALYLYYTQLGKCMYSGEAIEVSDIFSKNIYDIEHIFPRSKIKDDSLDNRVLVKKVINLEKGNAYPIDAAIRTKMAPFWKMLLDRKLISPKKYERLARNYELTDEELSSFVSRQLVETRQSTKAVAELLKKRYPSSKIVYVKAELVSDFRHEYHNDLLKCREVNDLHHAKDAYLNIVCGNVYDTKFTSRYFISELQKGTCSLNKMYDYDVSGAWTATNGKSISLVKSVMRKNNIRFTRYSYCRQGGLFDQNILKKGNGQVPIKLNSPRSDIGKYGGYNRATTTYFAFVEYTDNKGKKIRSFEPVDLYAEKEYRENPVEFIRNKLNASAVKILIPCVKCDSLLSIDGFRAHISSKSSGGSQLVLKPAVQLVLGYDKEKYIKYISNYLSKCAQCRNEKEVTAFDHISAEENMELYTSLIDKMTNTVFSVKFGKIAKQLSKKLETFAALSMYRQCVVIMQLLNMLHANVATGDLSLIDLPQKVGTVTIANKVQTSIQSLKLINQSVTGLYESEIDLLK